MDSRSARLNKVAPRRIRVQAAVWVTELHGPDRTAELEARVRRWIEEDPQHAAAFELATEAWQRSGNLPAHLEPRAAARRTWARVRAPRAVLAGLAILIPALMFAIYLARDPILTTPAGEQRTVELSDGTQVSLNANSRVVVQYDDRVRRVTLTKGEALFNVVKHQSRPFVVIIGDRKVIAVGTSFLVRREETSRTAYAVTLVEGRIAVEPITGPDVLPNAFVSGMNLLRPGVDSPSLDRVTAWQRGQLIFDDTTMSEAAAEFNRYGSNKITIDSAAARTMRVGGVFRISDPASFAHAMANAHHLRIVDRGKEIILADEQDDSR